MDRNDIIRKTDLLMNAVIEMPYKTIIPHNQIKEIIDDRNIVSREYYRIVAKVKKVLLKNYKKLLYSISGIGYEIQDPTIQGTVTVLKAVKKSKNNLKRGLDISRNTNTNELNQVQKNTHNEVYEYTQQGLTFLELTTSPSIIKSINKGIADALTTKAHEGKVLLPVTEAKEGGVKINKNDSLIVNSPESKGGFDFNIKTGEEVNNNVAPL